jgi:SWI/SNF-related matrix-associated actin-dependent regulator 1 of chromatin subfamily A
LSTTKDFKLIKRRILPTEERLKLSKAVSGQKQFPAPEGLKYLPFQLAGIEYALGGHHCYLADQMGLGKSVQALGVANALASKKILIVAPASLLANWEREATKWLVPLATPIVVKSAKAFSPEKLERTCILSYSLLINKFFFAQIKSIKWDLIILDEAHYLKNLRSQRSKQFFGKGGLIDHADAIGAKILALSGTPIVNRPIEIYGLVKKLCPEAINDMNWMSYGLKYCAGWQGKWGWDFTGASNLNELGHRLRSHFMVRRNKKDVLATLPDKFINVVYLDPSSEAKALVGKINSWEEQGTVKAKKVNFSEIAEMRTKLGELKAPRAVEYITELLESGHEKIVVFAHHKSVINILELGLDKYGVLTLTGETPMNVRQNLVDNFQEIAGYRVFLGSITAAGVGLTLTASSYVVIVEPSFVPGENEQAMDRCHRIGQKGNVIVDFLVYKDSLDARIINANIFKQQNILEVMK